MDPEALFSLPCFLEIIQQFLDVPSALALRSTCRRAKYTFSDPRFASWRRTTVWPLLQKSRATRLGDLERNVERVSVVTDCNIMWLLGSSAYLSSSEGDRENDEVVVDEDWTELDFGRAPFVTDKTLTKVSKACPNLQSLAIRRGSNELRINFGRTLSRITTRGILSVLEGCPRLETLCLSWCEWVNGDEVCQAIANSPIRKTLKYLNLDRTRKTSDVGVSALAPCHNLQELHLRDTRVTDIAPLSKCKLLEVLHVCRNPSLSAETVEEAVQGFQDSIRVLCCAGCIHVEKDLGLRILEGCPNLKVWNCLRGTGVGQGTTMSDDRMELEDRAKDLDVSLDNTFCCTAWKNLKKLAQFRNIAETWSTR